MMVSFWDLMHNSISCWMAFLLKVVYACLKVNDFTSFLSHKTLQDSIVLSNKKVANVQLGGGDGGRRLRPFDCGKMMVQKIHQASIIIQHSQGLLYIIRRKIQWWWIKWNLPRESVANLFSHMSLSTYLLMHQTFLNLTQLYKTLSDNEIIGKNSLSKKWYSCIKNNRACLKGISPLGSQRLKGGCSKFDHPSFYR